MAKTDTVDLNTRQIIDMWYDRDSPDFKYYEKAEQDKKWSFRLQVVRTDSDLTN